MNSSLYMMVEMHFLYQKTIFSRSWIRDLVGEVLNWDPDPQHWFISHGFRNEQEAKGMQKPGWTGPRCSGQSQQCWQPWSPPSPGRLNNHTCHTSTYWTCTPTYSSTTCPSPSSFLSPSLLHHQFPIFGPSPPPLLIAKRVSPIYQKFRPIHSGFWILRIS